MSGRKFINQLKPIKDVDDLKQKITNTIESISQETCNNVFAELKKTTFSSRAKWCSC